MLEVALRRNLVTRKSGSRKSAKNFSGVQEEVSAPKTGLFILPIDSPDPQLDPVRILDPVKPAATNLLFNFAASKTGFDEAQSRTEIFRPCTGLQNQSSSRVQPMMESLGSLTSIANAGARAVEHPPLGPGFLQERHGTLHHQSVNK